MPERPLEKYLKRHDQLWLLALCVAAFLLTYLAPVEASFSDPWGTLLTAQAIVEHAKVEAARLGEQAQADLEQALKRREQLALETISQAEAEAVEAVRNQAVELAIVVSARLLSESVGEAQSAKLIDEAIKDLPDNLH